MSFKTTTALPLLALASLTLVGCTINQGNAPTDQSGDGATGTQLTELPTELQLPFNLGDIEETRGQVNPIGVVRFSQDEPAIGHSGLDVPLGQGAPILAVASGPVLFIESAGDEWGGQKVVQLIKPTSDKTGWAFNYEHITPVSGLTVGQELIPGDIIGHKTAPADFTAHFELSEVFSTEGFTRNQQCWPELLDRSDDAALHAWWETYRYSAHLQGSWRSTEQEAAAPFRGLLDITTFPDGPQLCYPPGTDVR